MAEFLSAEWMADVERLSGEQSAAGSGSASGSGSSAGSKPTLEPVGLVVTNVPGQTEPRETVVMVTDGVVRFAEGPAKAAKFGVKVDYATARQLLACSGGFENLETSTILRHVQPIGNVFAAMGTLPKLRSAFSDELRTAIAAITD